MLCHENTVQWRSTVCRGLHTGPCYHPISHQEPKSLPVIPQTAGSASCRRWHDTPSTTTLNSLSLNISVMTEQSGGHCLYSQKPCTSRNGISKYMYILCVCMYVHMYLCMYLSIYICRLAFEYACTTSVSGCKLIH